MRLYHYVKKIIFFDYIIMHLTLIYTYGRRACQQHKFWEYTTNFLKMRFNYNLDSNSNNIN